MHAALGIISSEPLNAQDLYDNVLRRLYALSESRGIIDSYFIGYNPYVNESGSDLVCMDYIDPSNNWWYVDKFKSFGVPVTYLDDTVAMVNMKHMAHLSDEQLFELRPHTLLECLNYEPWVITENNRFIWSHNGHSYRTTYPFWKERLRRHINAGNYFSIMDYHF